VIEQRWKAGAASVAVCVLVAGSATAQPRIIRFPANAARDVNPDAHLLLTFSSAPTLGTSGQIRIYDAANNTLVDTLDLSIPPGPTAGAAGPTPPYATPYQYVGASDH
jgi:hypothetical protein